MKLYDKMCPKCTGHMYINEDGDLKCLTCGKILVKQIRRNYDSRAGKIRSNKKEGVGSDVDLNSKVDERGIWDRDASNNDSTLARQRSMGSPRRAGLTPRR